MTAAVATAFAPPATPSTRWWAGGGWQALAGGVVTLALGVGLTRQLLGSGLAGLAQALPANPLFYAVFAVAYAVPVAGDFVICRRLWGMSGDGLVALIRKRIANEVVLSYSGEAMLYAWASRRPGEGRDAFGAIKDVTILSAMAGNAVTIALIALALPFGSGLAAAGGTRGLVLAMVAMAATSVPFLIFSRRVFSLPASLRWWIFEVHALRVVAGSLLITAAWALALPAMAVATMVALAAARLVVSRLPLPNKDMLFANVAVLMVGQADPLAGVIALSAALTLLIHVCLAAGYGAWRVTRGPGRVASD